MLSRTFSMADARPPVCRPKKAMLSYHEATGEEFSYYHQSQSSLIQEKLHGDTQNIGRVMINEKRHSKNTMKLRMNADAQMDKYMEERSSFSKPHHPSVNNSSQDDSELQLASQPLTFRLKK